MNRFIKKFLFGILAVCILSLSACAGGKMPVSDNTQNSGSADNDSAQTTPNSDGVIEMPQSTAFENVPTGAQKWIDKAADSAETLMSYSEIQALNKSMREKCNALTDIEKHSLSMSASKIESLIEDSSGPSLPKYDEKGKAISQVVFNEIKSNRNLNALYNASGEITLKRAVTVQRTDIRALPTSVEFYNNSDKQDHDRMQESELAAASAVLILHTSTDGKFYFIQSYYYAGWVSAQSVAIATDSTTESWTTYAKLLNMSENATKDMSFVVITDSQLNLGGVKLDMGTALPLAKDQSKAANNTYRVVLPAREADGTLKCIEADISSSSACIGFAEYSLRNFYIQAFKYAGTPYGWGGMHGNVDCSSYVLSVFKTFGFVFPRNTSQQNKVVGSVVNAEGKSLAEKISVLSSADAPVVIYISGHAMIYLGEINDIHYIIHAPGGRFVCEEPYDGISSVIRICEVG